MTYPGTTQLPPANCQSTLGPNGNITIYVPLSNVNEPGAIDNRLHEVTATTMTLQEPANTDPPDPSMTTGFGGVFFNLIDVAPAYVFDPTELKITSITKLLNGHILLHCVGVPNQLNTVRSTADILTPFSFLASVMANPDGTFDYEDASPPPNKGFYRLTLP